MDKSALLAVRLPAGEVEIPGVGTIRVRGLSREEMIGIDRGDLLTAERKTLALAMVDPELSEAEVLQWQRSSPASEINTVVVRVNELSGIASGSAREAYKSLRDEP